MNVTKWLFLLSLVLFPLGELIRISLIHDVVIKPLDIAVGLTTLIFCIDVSIHHNIKTKVYSNWLFKPIIYKDVDC